MATINRLIGSPSMAGTFNFCRIWTEGGWPAAGNCAADEETVEFHIGAEGASCSIAA
jgi:hypothetical protein